VVVPSDINANLPSAKVVSVQQLCPLKVVEHAFITIDSAGFAIALDALNHDGIASITRVLPQIFSVCFRVNAQGMNVDVANQLEALFNDLVHGIM
jgi:triacylglycerol lipase